MNARFLLGFSILGAFLGCAPADASDDVAPESTESDLTTSGRGLRATGGGYWANQSNVGRELDLAGAANVPGVLTSSHSTSPYAFAATVELVAWTNVSAENGTLTIWMRGKPASRQGKAAKALYQALNLPEVDESGAKVKRTSGGSVACYAYPDFYQCALSGLTDVQPK